ncbi:hypothetical protein COOONC_15179 [Cooperia oncophora]
MKRTIQLRRLLQSDLRCSLRVQQDARLWIAMIEMLKQAVQPISHHLQGDLHTSKEYQ